MRGGAGQSSTFCTVPWCLKLLAICIKLCSDLSQHEFLITTATTAEWS